MLIIKIGSLQPDRRTIYVLDYRRLASVAIKEEGIENLESHSISKVDIYFIVCKQTPGAAELMKRMEKAYQSLRADGTLSDAPRSEVQSPISTMNRQSSIVNPKGPRGRP